jgi:TonB family protein
MKRIFMKNTLILFTLFSAAISPLLFAQQSEPVKLSKYLSNITQPVPIERVAPKYPLSAARNGREGWAKMSYIIEKDGSVSNVLVTETSGSKDFAKAAKRAMTQWKYHPAFENGKAIQQCINSVRLDFKMAKEGHGQTGVGSRFRNKYKKTLTALKNKEFEQTKALLAEFKKFKKMHLSESNYYHLLAYDYAKAINDEPLQLHHLYRTTFFDKHLIPEPQQLSILSNIFSLEISLHKFHQAQATLKQLHKLPSAKPYLVHFEQAIAKVELLIGSDKNLVVNGNIKDKDYWYHTLVRNEFSISQINGQINKLDIRCANKRHIYTVENNNTWTLPSHWKQCSIFVFGEDNASFTLIEHPLKA